MAARDRMSAVSGATLSLLRDAYQRRDKVAVITFRQEQAQLLLPPTSSVHIAGRRLARFDTGGKTPLAQGLLAARDVVVREKARDRARRSLVVVLTDGRATGGPDPLGRARVAAACLVAEGAAAVVVDCETSYVRLGLAEQLAAHLGAPVGAAGAAAGRRPDPAGQDAGRPQRRVGEESDAAGSTARRSRRRPDHPRPSQRAAAGRAHRCRARASRPPRSGWRCAPGIRVSTSRCSSSSRAPSGKWARRPRFANSAACTTSTASAVPSSGTRWARAGRGRASTAATSTTPPPRRTAGPRSPAGWQSSATTSTCSTSSPIR